MKAARIERSDRLQRVAALLETGQEYSTMEIVIQANVMAVNSAVAELRQNGMDIHCQRRGRYWYYKNA
jgi:biotin operon repressor